MFQHCLEVRREGFLDQEDQMPLTSLKMGKTAQSDGDEGGSSVANGSARSRRADEPSYI
jgi:hypothetical protein